MLGMPSFSVDLPAHIINVAGVDEAGRGPLAGPVVAAAVILPREHNIDGLADSKTLSAKQRENLEQRIKQDALTWALGQASVTEVDEINILHATMLAMQRAVDGLALKPQWVLVDGNRLPRWSHQGTAVVRGDASEACIAAASILAKQHRDGLMLALHQQFPEYGFDRHKGYGTKQHMSALATYGACIEHRRSFAPVARVLDTASKTP